MFILIILQLKDLLYETKLLLVLFTEKCSKLKSLN